MVLHFIVGIVWEVIRDIVGYILSGVIGLIVGYIIIILKIKYQEAKLSIIENNIITKTLPQRSSITFYYIKVKNRGRKAAKNCVGEVSILQEGEKEWKSIPTSWEGRKGWIEHVQINRGDSKNLLIYVIDKSQDIEDTEGKLIIKVTADDDAKPDSQEFKIKMEKGALKLTPVRRQR
jgi:hypothetical protein